MRAADATIVALPRGYACTGVAVGARMTRTSTSLRCFVRKHNGATYNVCAVRMPISESGEQAEADFGRLRMITDPATASLETVWAPSVELSQPRLCLRGRHMAKKMEAMWAFAEASPANWLKSSLATSRHRWFGVDPLSISRSREFRE